LKLILFIHHRKSVILIRKMRKYTKLTVEQITLASQYRKKWQLIATSIETINHEICAELVKRLYKELAAQEPEILFFKSPHEALKNRGEFIQKTSAFSQVIHDFERKIVEEIYSGFTFSPSTWNKLKDLYNIDDTEQWMGMNYSVMEQLKINFKKLYSSTCCEWFRPSESNIYDGDFLISTLELNIISMSSWQLFKCLNEQMGWYNPLVDICIICDRPRIMNFDEKRELHMDGAPAVEYADGFSVYAFHGTVLPKKYGEIPSNKWDPCWLLEKTSDKMRRTLLSGMSFESIRDTLNLKEIDSSKEYRLWTVENETKGKPIVLLTKETDQGIVTDSVAARLKKVKKAVEWLHLRYCQEDIFDGD
jgi:hypothetical protein